MSTLNPQLNADVSFDRPVQQAPSLLGNLAGLAGDMANTYARTRPTVSATQVKNEALSPFAARMDEIYGMDISQNQKDQMYNSTVREYLVNNPEYRGDISELAGEYGYTLAVEDTTLQVERAFNEWQQSPVGQAATAIVAVRGPTGSIDEQATQTALREYHQEQMSLVIMAEDLANRNTTDGNKWQTLSSDLYSGARRQAEGLVVQASTNPEYLDNPTEVMSALNSAIIAQQAAVREVAEVAGISPSYIEENIAAAIKPLTDLRDTYNNMAGDQTRMMEAIVKAQEFGVMQEFIGINQIYADPVAREIILNSMLSSAVTKENLEPFLDVMRNLDGTGNFNPFNLALPTIPSEVEIVEGTPPLREEKIADLREQIEADPELPQRQMGVFIASIQGNDMSTPDKKAAFETSIMNATLLADALNRPIGYETLNQLLSPDTMRRASQNFEEGSNVQQAILGLISSQVRRHRATFENQDNYEIAVIGGKFTVLREPIATDEFNRPSEIITVGDRQMIPILQGEVTGGVSGAVRNLNLLWSSAKAYPAISGRIANQLNLLNSGVEANVANQTMYDMSAGVSNVTLTDTLGPIARTTTGEANPLIPLIDRTEGGGGYDTLFGFSQREGGPFAGTRVNTMTIEEAIEFSNPDGEYGQWVKNNSPGGVVATPMGRYQFVGRTLRHIADLMNLAPDTVFNKKTQDAMFSFWAARTVRGKSIPAAREALRSQWEGFRSVSDSELDRAIAGFMNLPAVPNYELDRAGGNDRWADNFPQPTSRPDNLTSGGGSINLSTRSAPPVQAATSPTATSTSPRPQTRDPAAASRSLTATQRNQVYSRLRQGGDIQEILAEILGEGEADG